MSNTASPLQSLYRLTVMAGTFAVGGMAAYHYGPPPERLAGWIDQAVERVGELQAEASTPAAPAAPSGVAQASAELEAPPAFGNASPDATLALWEDTATADAFGAAAAPVDHAERLRAAGAVSASVEPWGTSGLAYRATASAPTGSGMSHRFASIAETPEEATNKVVAQLRAALGG